MPENNVVSRFDNVVFAYGNNDPLFDEVNFSVRRGMKVALMGQNGAGKSTLFSLISGLLKPQSGRVSSGISIAVARQVIPRDELGLTVREFFEKCLPRKFYDIDAKIDDVLEVVHLKGHEKIHDRVMKSFSGGQQARLLLASALIQDADLLLLDEPTNNLDRAGIDHLTEFLIMHDKTCIVISHDADFLNTFTDGVLYLDVFTRKIEQYVGNYFDVQEEIAARLERENRKNAQLAKEIQANKDKSNFFAHKGGKMRLVAKRMRQKAVEAEETMVDVRREDKTIRPFTIPAQTGVGGQIVAITSCNIMDKQHRPVVKSVDIVLHRGEHLLLSGPNGIGKSTLLEAIATRKAAGVKIAPDVKIGYYRQDFSTLNFEDTVRDSLLQVMDEQIEEDMRRVAAGFLITAKFMGAKIGDLSEGQKGLVAFARLVLEKPGLLILDEPTNHINFRHIPVIAAALDAYEGTMILVSHVPEFVEKIRIDRVLDLEK